MDWIPPNASNGAIDAFEDANDNEDEEDGKSSNVEVFEAAVDEELTEDTESLGTVLFWIDVKISKQFCGVVNDFEVFTGLLLDICLLILMDALLEGCVSVLVGAIVAVSLLALLESIVVLTDATVAAVVTVLLVLV